MRTTPFVLAVLLAPAPAFADAASTLAADLETSLYWLNPLRESPAARKHTGGEACQPAINAARKAGVADQDKIHADWFRYQLPDEVHYDASDSAYLAFDELVGLCDEYTQLRKMIDAAYEQQEALELYDIYSKEDPTWLAADLGKSFIAKAEKCIAETDAAIKAGAPADRKTKIGSLEISLKLGRTQICQALADFGAAIGVKIKDAKAAEFDRIAEKYKAVGVKGAKLKVFVENDNIVWLGKGCKKVLEPKKLAKAKKLHQWWEGPDGTHTIRTYTFKGNAVKSVKDKVYDTRGQASRGCK